MNSLSWLIYLIQVSDSIKELCTVFGATFFILGGALLAALHCFALFEGAEDKDWMIINKLRRTFLWVVIPMLIIAALLPSRQTLILIAGSEIGGHVIKSQEVRDVVNPGVDLLKTWIKTETERLTKEKK